MKNEPIKDNAKSHERVSITKRSNLKGQQSSFFPDIENTGNESLSNAITISGSRNIDQETGTIYLDRYLSSLVNQNRIWLIGGARGMDQWATEWLLDHKETCWIVVPFTTIDQPNSTQSLFRKVEKVIELKLPKSKSAYIARNKYMVDRSELVFGFWTGKGGTLSTIRYAIYAFKDVHAYHIKQKDIK
jgi:predicted Rossmann fold nucleotide-binding protein DprA/Smf involved in DNA uptake